MPLRKERELLADEDQGQPHPPPLSLRMRSALDDIRNTRGVR